MKRPSDAGADGVRTRFSVPVTFRFCVFSGHSLEGCVTARFESWSMRPRLTKPNKEQGNEQEQRNADRMPQLRLDLPGGRPAGRVALLSPFDLASGSCGGGEKRVKWPHEHEFRADSLPRAEARPVCWRRI